MSIKETARGFSADITVTPPNVRLDGVYSGEGGDGTADIEDAVKGASAEIYLGHGSCHQLTAGFTKLAELPIFVCAHVGVAKEVCVLDSRVLPLSGCFDWFSDGDRFFASPVGSQLFEVYLGHIDLEVDTIHQRAGDSLLVASGHAVGADAGVGSDLAEAIIVVLVEYS